MRYQFVEILEYFDDVLSLRLNIDEHIPQVLNDVFAVGLFLSIYMSVDKLGPDLRDELFFLFVYVDENARGYQAVFRIFVFGMLDQSL